MVPLFWVDKQEGMQEREGHSSQPGLIVTLVLVSSTMWQAADQPKPFHSPSLILSLLLLLFFSFKYKLHYLFHFPSLCCACDFSPSVPGRLQLYRWLQLHSLQISSALFIQSDEKWKGELLTPLFCFSPLPLALLNFWRGFVLLGVRGRRCQTGNYVESVCLATFLPVGNVYLNSKLMIWIFVIHA